MSANVLIGDQEMFLCVYTKGYTSSPYQVSVLSHSRAITASLRVLLTAKIALLRCPSEPRWPTSAVAPAQALLPPKMIWTPRHDMLVGARVWRAQLLMEKKESRLPLIESKLHGDRRCNTSLWPLTSESCGRSEVYRRKGSEWDADSELTQFSETMITLI